ncbi:hypothetical protein TNCV_784001 [Trichonephila clavipes]|nr:hypothetical protein TNCV_784001 [Trichonephila clavipes]
MRVRIIERSKKKNNRMLASSRHHSQRYFTAVKSFKTTGMCSRRHGEVVEKYDACRRQIYRPISKKNRRTTAQQVANQFLAASGKQISKTVARRLRRTIRTQTCRVCPIDQTAPYCPFAMVS